MFHFFLSITAPRSRWVFRSLTAIATTRASHMHVFSAVGNEKEVLSGHKIISHPSLVSLCLSHSFPFSSRLHFLSLNAALPLFTSPAVFSSPPSLSVSFLSHPLLVYFEPQLSEISCCPVWSLKSASAARPGRAGVVPHQGHTAAWDWRAV